MKKLFFTAALLLAACFTFGQAFQKGNMVTIHTITVELKPNVTMDKCLIFIIRNGPPTQINILALNVFLVNAFVGPNVLKTSS